MTATIKAMRSFHAKRSQQNAKSHSSPLFIRKDLLHPPDLSVFQPHFDPARMMGCGSQDILHHPDGSVAGSLISFQDDCDALTDMNVFANLAVHMDSGSVFSERAGIGMRTGLLGSPRRMGVIRRQA
jgi:hypothetical protein